MNYSIDWDGPGEVDRDDLTTPYKPVAVAFTESPRLEYVTRDCISIYERIDDNLSIIRDTDGKIIGMCLDNYPAIVANI